MVVAIISHARLRGHPLLRPFIRVVGITLGGGMECMPATPAVFTPIPRDGLEAWERWCAYIHRGARSSVGRFLNRRQKYKRLSSVQENGFTC